MSRVALTHTHLLQYYYYLLKTNNYNICYKYILNYFCECIKWNIFVRHIIRNAFKPGENTVYTKTITNRVTLVVADVTRTRLIYWSTHTKYQWSAWLETCFLNASASCSCWLLPSCRSTHYIPPTYSFFIADIQYIPCILSVTLRSQLFSVDSCCVIYRLFVFKNLCTRILANRISGSSSSPIYVCSGEKTKMNIREYSACACSPKPVNN